MWKNTGLIGRDNLLKSHIRPRLISRKGMILTGGHGMGKTALLEWAFDYVEGEKAMISATWSKKLIMQTICQGWGLKVFNSKGEEVDPSKALVPWMEEVINCSQGKWLFIDDLHRVSPSVLQIIKPLRDRCPIVSTLILPVKKDELKRMLFGLKYIDVPPLNKKDLERLASKSVPFIPSSTPIDEAIHASRGRPAFLFHALRGEVTPDSAKTQDEEIDLSPALLIFFGLLMAARYVARGMDSQSMVMLSGIGAGFALVARFILFRGMRR